MQDVQTMGEKQITNRILDGRFYNPRLRVRLRNRWEYAIRRHSQEILENRVLRRKVQDRNGGEDPKYNVKVFFV